MWGSCGHGPRLQPCWRSTVGLARFLHLRTGNSTYLRRGRHGSASKSLSPRRGTCGGVRECGRWHIPPTGVGLSAAQLSSLGTRAAGPGALEEKEVQQLKWTALIQHFSSTFTETQNLSKASHSPIHTPMGGCCHEGHCRAPLGVINLTPLSKSTRTATAGQQSDGFRPRCCAWCQAYDRAQCLVLRRQSSQR